jgi:thymidylate kinase
MRAHEIVDGAIARRAVVVGSLPPDGRDLDVLLRGEAETARVADALRRAGFVCGPGAWLRFAHSTAELVELIPAAEAGLPPAAEEALFAGALPLAGCERLARPAPPDTLLLLARKVAAGEPLTRRRRRRVDAALAEDPDAWGHAEQRADAWGAGAALRALRESHSQPIPAGRRGLLPGGVRARAGAARDRARGQRRGAVIALSGLDGAGKSTQAHALADALERLGYDVAVEWTRLGDNERLRPAAHSPKALPATPFTTVRRPRRAVQVEARATGLTLETAWRQWRRISGFLARDYVVVCDRYTLDWIVSLRYLVDARRRFPVQRALLCALTRRPTVAYLLDVAPETAWARKGELGVEALRRHQALYREERSALGVARLDGERAPDELAARIAREAWTALRRRRS